MHRLRLIALICAALCALPAAALAQPTGGTQYGDPAATRPTALPARDVILLGRTMHVRGTLSGAAFASRLPNGNTLIADANNSRAVEVDPTDVVVWEYATNTETGSNTSPLPTRAVRLANGNTLIADQLNHRVIEVTPDKQIVFTQGQLNMPGNGDNLLNGPYDAKAINDFTGLTNPKGAGDDEEEVDDQGSDQGQNSQGNQGQSNQGQHSQSQNGPNHNGPNQG